MREYRGNGLLHDEALAVEEVGAFRDAGGATIVDCTSEGLGRQPEALRRVSEATGVHIVMGSGHYRRPYLDEARLDRLSVDAIADGHRPRPHQGVGDTGVRAGIIGEIGCDRYIGALEERVFRAAARAHRRTGVTITTHAARWPVGEAQLDLLAEEGVDPGRVIIGHCDMVPDPAYHLRLARRGAWVQFDTVQGANDWDTRAAARLDPALFDAGLEAPAAAVPGRVPDQPTSPHTGSRATPTCSTRSGTAPRRGRSAGVGPGAAVPGRTRAGRLTGARADAASCRRPPARWDGRRGRDEPPARRSSQSASGMGRRIPAG